MIPKKSSKELIAESALELISKNSIEQVSVQDITHNCNISTRTFYNHFKDKYDLLTWIYIDMLQTYYEAHYHELTFHKWIQVTAVKVWEYLDFFLNACKYSGQNSLRESLLAPMRALYLRLIKDVYHDEITDSLYNAVSFFLYGSIGYVEDKLKTRPVPPEEAVLFFENGLPASLKEYLSKDSAIFP